ncbi:MAG: 50S ribosomal protein L22 [Pyrinomonadaceae bacterium]
MEAIAKTKYLKGSPRKTRLVIDMIRGVNVSRALAILKFTDKRAAQPIAKCLNSAIANATYLAEQQNIAIDPDGLWVKTCFVDMGPTKGRRRMRPAPQGRAYREQRHYCHITIQVTSETQAKDEPFKKSEATLKKIAAKKALKAEKSASKPAVTAEEIEKPKMTAAPVEVDTALVDSSETIDNLTPEASAEVQNAVAKGEIADAKNVASQTPAELNETQPADEAQQKINEDVERQ